jgi:hypothetical protein
VNVRSNPQLDALVAEAQRVVRGVGPQDLRDRNGLRRSLATQMSWVQAELDQLIVERPRRRILRQSTPIGTVRAVYSEIIDLAGFGPAVIRRASHVEPDDEGWWWADLRPVAGPVLGPFAVRSAALGAEVAWLEASWLSGLDSGPVSPSGRRGLDAPTGSQGR